jgi:hypothetical protein
VDNWLFERLMTFEAGAEDFEDNGDGEADDARRKVDSPEFSGDRVGTTSFSETGSFLKKEPPSPKGYLELTLGLKMLNEALAKQRANAINAEVLSSHDLFFFEEAF